MCARMPRATAGEPPIQCRDASGALARVALGCLACAVAACGTSSVQAPNRPPSPGSISVAEPGGDASDAHEAALERQLSSAWGERSDKGDQVLVPLPDWEHWKRVRYWGVDQFVGFRYGKEHHVIAIVLLQEVPEGEAVTSRNCLRRFELWANPQLEPYSVELGHATEKKGRWREQPLFIRSVDGRTSFGFSQRSFSAAWTAYPAYAHACLVYGVAVPWDTQPELAQRVRARFVEEGFERMNPLTQDPPQRY